MTTLAYRLTEPVNDFQKGTELELTARFGDWHPKDVKLEPQSSERGGSVELTWDRLRDVSELLKETAEA